MLEDVDKRREYILADCLKKRLDTYTMKMRLYPSSSQAEKIDKIFRALYLAYNMTFHEVFEKNPEVCTEPNEDGSIWPDFKKMTNKKWRAELIKKNPAVGEAPAAAITTNNGILNADAKRAWKEGMHNLPVDKADRRQFRFYNSSKKRRSYVVQMDSQKLKPSQSNDKVAWITVPGVSGEIKARGFNRKISFGEGGIHTYEEAINAGEVANKLTVRVSKDLCGDYYISITFFVGKKDPKRFFYKPIKSNENSEALGIDLGIKNVAILSNGVKIENKRFKKQKEKTLKKMSHQLSRRWGPANMAFRDYNKEVRSKNKSNDEEKNSFAIPSNRYLKTKKNHQKLQRKIARRRENYYHCQTAKIVVNATDMIAVETLYVRNMMKNHKLSYALSDAAMSDFLQKLKYKCAIADIEIREIGAFEPSSQMCSKCGEINKKVKNLKIREWTCPKCGEKHDRDVNAAKNILKIAQTQGNSCKDKKIERKNRGQPKKMIVFEDNPDMVVEFRKELSKLNDPRYVVVDKRTNTILDDAGGVGYRSSTKAKNCYRARKKWATKNHN